MKEHNQRHGAFGLIILPLVLIILVIGIAAYFLVFDTNGNPNNIRKGGDIASIYLILLTLPSLFFSIVVLIFFILINTKISHALSSFFPKIKKQVFQINQQIQASAKIATKPFIEVDVRMTAISNIFSKKD